jgi:DNA-binding IclR family transcriptional regulator
MLKQVLHELETAKGPLSLDDLSRRMHVERSVLEGTIQTLVRLGRLRDDGQASVACDVRCSACATAHQCTLATKTPRTYSVVARNSAAGCRGR